MPRIPAFLRARAGGYLIASMIQRGSSLVVTILVILIAGITVFGRLEVFRTVTGLAAVIGVLGLDAALAEHIEREEHDSQVTALGIGRYLLAGSLVVGLASLALVAADVPDGIALTMIFAAIGLGQSVIMVGLVICRIRGSAMSFFVLSALMALGTIAPLAAILGAIDTEVIWRLAVAWWIGTLVTSAAASLYLQHRFSLKGRASTTMVRRLLATGLPVAPLGLLAWVIQSIDRVVLYATRGAAEVGWYGLANRLILVASLALFPIQALWWPAAVRARRTGAPLAEEAVAAGFARLTAAACLLGEVGVVMFVDDIMVGSGVVLLMLSTFVNFLYFFPVVPIFSSGRTFICTQAFAIGAIVNLVLTLALAPTLGFFGAAVSTVIGYGAVVWFVTIRAHQIDTMRYSVMAPAVVSTIVVVASVPLAELGRVVSGGVILLLATTAVMLGRSGVRTIWPARSSLTVVLVGDDR